jgi:hypothetical protein
MAMPEDLKDPSSPDQQVHVNVPQHLLGACTSLFVQSASLHHFLPKQNTIVRKIFL